MKTVHQTLFGGTDGPMDLLGNCFPACVASLLELPLEKVPHFYQVQVDPAEADRDFIVWLRSHGHTSMHLVWNADWHEWICARYHGVLAIFGGKSPRGEWQHAVVGLITRTGWQLFHDPHPSGAGIVGEPACVELLVPLVLAQVVA